MRVELTDKILRIGVHRAIQIGSLDKSVTKGLGNVAGCIGEEIFQSVRPQATFKNDYHKDFICNGKRIDVKSRIAHYPAKPEHGFFISMRGDEPAVDFYVFVAVYAHLQYADIIGYMSVEEFKKVRIKISKGDPRADGKVYEGTSWRVLGTDMKAFVH